MEKRKVLVSGATGQQGGWVIKALQKDGHDLVGITRKIDSPKSVALTKQGVKMISADFTDLNVLATAMETVDTVFAVTTPFEEGTEKETEQGITLVNAAAKAGVGHFILSTISDGDQATGIPHFESKYEVEKYLATMGLNYTIAAPAYFMDNVILFNTDNLQEGVLKAALPPDRVLQQIAAEDIGRFVAIVVNKRETMFGKRINLAGDEISGKDAAAALTRVLGREITYEGFSPEYLRAESEDMALMFEWFNETGYSADLKALEPYGFKTFEEWAITQDWSILKAEEEPVEG